MIVIQYIGLVMCKLEHSRGAVLLLDSQYEKVTSVTTDERHTIFVKDDVALYYSSVGMT